MHEGVCGGHFAPQVMVHCIVRAGFYWPTIFKDAYDFTRMCASCQKNSGRMKRETLPLNPIFIYAPLLQWGLDVIGLINPNSSQGHSYILTATDYFTKWSEAKGLKNVTTYEVITFVEENVLI